MATIDRSSLIPALPGFLTWKEGSSLIASSCRIYIHYVYYRLREWSTRGGLNLYDAALNLPRPNQQRLVLAPGLYYLLNSAPEPGSEDIESLKKFIQVEQYLCGQSAECPDRSWTALGDCYLPQTASAQGESLATDGVSWREDLPFKAPKLGNIVLDGFSPTVTSDHPAVFGEISHHSPEELDMVRRRIEQSLDYIASMSNVARLMINSSVQVMRAVRAAVFDDKAMSRRRLIGAMAIYNAHSERWTVKKIVNAIVHEAIHSLIYKLQLAVDLYTDENLANELTAVSPWSGRTLQLHSFVHGCFVWYGLWRFWSMSPAEDEEAATLREKARNGFLSGSPLSNISSEARDAIQPIAQRAIEQMHAQALGARA